jgi:predicted Fe-Mo cluster-binding NifX family protein
VSTKPVEISKLNASEADVRQRKQGGTMKIAVGTDDNRTIRKGHFGESHYFRVIEMLNGEIVSQEVRQNPTLESDANRHTHGQAERILELLEDCSLFMARSMGKRSMAKLADQDIDCIISEYDHIDLAVAEYIFGKEDAFQYYDVRKGGLIPCSKRRIKTTSKS